MKAPSAPDPVATANAQAGMNRTTAITQQQLNMMDQYSPDGSIKYTQNGERTFTDENGKTVTTPSYSVTTELSPVNQQIKDQTDQASLNLGTIANTQSGFLKDYLGKGIDTSGAPALRTSIGNGFSGDIGGSFTDRLGGNYTTDLGPDWKTSYAGADDFSADRQRYTEALKARAAPDQAAQARDLETQLIGRGLRPGTAAWNSEMDRLQRGVNDFSLAADLAGGQEQARMVGMARDAATFGNDATLTRATFGNTSELARMAAQNDAAATAAGFRNNSALSSAGFDNAARAQYLSELYNERNQPINEIGALLSGSQVQNPQQISTPQAQVAGVDYAGLVSDKYKADTAAYQSKMGGLFGLLSAPFSMFKFSDRRLKTDIKRVGTLDNGLSVYSYRYLDSDMPQIGLMADEVEKVHPEAVAVGSDGFKRVRYDIAVEAA